MNVYIILYAYYLCMYIYIYIYAYIYIYIYIYIYVLTKSQPGCRASPRHELSDSAFSYRGLPI